MKATSTVLTALLCVSSLIGAPDLTTPVQNGDKVKYEQRHIVQLDNARKIRPDVIFIGDSITAQANWASIWDKKLKPLKPANFGCSSDKTQNVLWRLENGNWDKIEPKVAVVMIGVNNGDKGDDLAEAQKKIITKINEKFPKVKIVFIPVLPRIIPKSKKNEAEIFKANSKASAFEKEFPNVKVLDMSKKFLNADGSLNKSLYTDGLHLTNEGYEVWASELVPVIKQLLKGK
ncbi:MAG TPA: hypothetical protein DET40_06835 [Lentisphaeria bacterium]|nr:MAG: hypothetical protein A2X45_07465 [Lentisphaerae bacterium GWF2_50_93]HCE43245.1 hypothetical protein [Lentisphaeria bacterium]